jgi:hypothetical protein
MNHSLAWKDRRHYILLATGLNSLAGPKVRRWPRFPLAAGTVSLTDMGSTGGGHFLPHIEPLGRLKKTSFVARPGLDSHHALSI